MYRHTNVTSKYTTCVHTVNHTHSSATSHSSIQICTSAHVSIAWFCQIKRQGVAQATISVVDNLEQHAYLLQFDGTQEPTEDILKNGQSSHNIIPEPGNTEKNHHPDTQTDDRWPTIYDHLVAVLSPKQAPPHWVLKHDVYWYY